MMIATDRGGGATFKGARKVGDEQREFFEQHFRQMTTDELVDRWRKGQMTEIASGVLDSVLSERGIGPDQREQISRELQDDSHDERHGHLASLGDRFVGQLLDNIVALTCGVFVLVVLKALSAPEGLAILGALSGWLLYNLLSDGLHRGQSLGKRVVRTAVVHGPDRIPCSYGRSILRNLPLLFLGLLDWIFILGDSRRRLGDYLAGTEVVKASRGLERKKQSSPN